MADKVFIHIGLPKTGTTYLQTVMWAQRDTMHSQGVLLPGRERRDHLWATRVLREDPLLDTYAPKVLDAWDRLTDEIAGWSGTALISHEFFASAGVDQVAGMIADLAPAEVHVVVTAREPLGLFAASWQESIKNRDQIPLDDYAREASDNPMAVWNWRTLDVRLVLERWSAGLPPEQVHVLPLPGPGAPRDLIWRRFATLIGMDPGAFDLSGTFPNESMGVVEAETLRRINAHLETFDLPFDRGVYIRTFLADERLVPRGGERFWPAPDQVEECRARGRAAVDYIRQAGFDVIGEVDALLVPEVLEERRHPTPRLPRWPWSWWRRCSTTYAHCARSAGVLSGSSNVSRRRSAPGRCPATGRCCASGARGCSGC